MRVLTLIMLLLISHLVLASNDNTFSNVTAGITIEKPDEWRFLTAQQNADNLARVELDDASFQEQMRKYASAPLVVMSKHAEPFNDLNPSLKITIKPFGQLKGTDPKEMLGMIYPAMEKAYRDFKLVQAPHDTVVSGLKAAHMRIDYTLVNSDGKEFPTASELWIVPRGDFYFLIGVGIRQDEKTGSRSEIMAILNSLVITP